MKRASSFCKFSICHSYSGYVTSRSFTIHHELPAVGPSAKIYPAAKKYPPPVTLPSVLSALCIAQN